MPEKHLRVLERDRLGLKARDRNCVWRTGRPRSHAFFNKLCLRSHSKIYAMSQQGGFFKRVSGFPGRFKTALSYYRRPLSQILPWLVKSRENTNFTYDLSPLNLDYLASFVSLVTKCSVEAATGYIQEATQDDSLKRHIQESTLEKDQHSLADAEARYGRRLGWYAIVRAQKPAIVIETGVDKGLGTCLIASALLRNTEEGFPGRIYGIDINSESGYLLGGRYADFGEIVIGDSVQSLARFEKSIDCFINDSDHSPGYERKEYETIRDKLSTKAILIGDNAHCSTELRNFALATNRNFLFFREEPKDHWYPGAGIGVAFIKD